MRSKSASEILHQIARVCSAGERCTHDIRTRLDATALSDEEKQHIIDRLTAEKFIDEGRYCRSFVNDKLRFNRWGRIKITYELRRKAIPAHLIAESIDEIDETVYETILSTLLHEKKKVTKGKTPYEIHQKLMRFAAGRGFEHALTAKLLQSKHPNEADTDILE